jgi:hypothetical protein
MQQWHKLQRPETAAATGCKRNVSEELRQALCLDSWVFTLRSDAEERALRHFGEAGHRPRAACEREHSCKFRPHKSDKKNVGTPTGAGTEVCDVGNGRRSYYQDTSSRPRLQLRHATIWGWREAVLPGGQGHNRRTGFFQLVAEANILRIEEKVWWDREIWLRVLRDSGYWVIALQTADQSSRQTGRPRETRPQLSDRKKHLVTSPRVGSTPRHTDWLTNIWSQVPELARHQDILTDW